MRYNIKHIVFVLFSIDWRKDWSNYTTNIPDKQTVR